MKSIWMFLVLISISCGKGPANEKSKSSIPVSNDSSVQEKKSPNGAENDSANNNTEESTQAVLTDDVFSDIEFAKLTLATGELSGSTTEESEVSKSPFPQDVLDQLSEVEAQFRTQCHEIEARESDTCQKLLATAKEVSEPYLPETRIKKAAAEAEGGSGVAEAATFRNTETSAEAPAPVGRDQETAVPARSTAEIPEGREPESGSRDEVKSIYPDEVLPQLQELRKTYAETCRSVDENGAFVESDSQDCKDILATYRELASPYQPEYEVVSPTVKKERTEARSPAAPRSAEAPAGR